MRQQKKRCGKEQRRRQASAPPPPLKPLHGSDAAATTPRVQAPPVKVGAVVTAYGRCLLSDEVYLMEDVDGWQYHWNVSEGMRLAQARGEMVWFRPGAFGITPEHLTGRYAGLDMRYALTTNLEKPLLFVPFRSRAATPEVRATALLIDGWHRLYKAVVSDVQELPAYALTEAEAASILLWALPPGRGIDWGQKANADEGKSVATNRTNPGR